MVKVLPPCRLIPPPLLVNEPLTVAVAVFVICTPEAASWVKLPLWKRVAAPSMSRADADWLKTPPRPAPLLLKNRHQETKLRRAPRLACTLEFGLILDLR